MHAMCMFAEAGEYPSRSRQPRFIPANPGLSQAG